MNTTLLTDHVDTEEDPLRGHLLYLYARKGWILTAVLVCGGAGVVTAELMQPEYQADSLVQVEPRSNGLGLSSEVSDLFSSDSEAVTEIEILRSRMVIGRMVEALGLEVTAEPKRLPVIGDYLSRSAWPRPSWGWLHGWAWRDERIVVGRIDVPERWLGEEIVVSKLDGDAFRAVTPDGDVLEGRVGRPLVGPDGEFTLVVDALSGAEGGRHVVRERRLRDVIQQVRQRLRITEKTRNTGILQITVTDANPERARDIAGALVTAYVDQNVGRSAAEAERSLAFLNEQIPALQARIGEAETKLNVYRSENQSIDLNLETQSTLERVVSIDTQLSLLELEETELARRFTQRHPTYQALLQKKRQLTRERDGQSQSIRTLPQTQQNMLKLMRNLDVSQQIFREFLQKSQELEVLKAGAVGNARLIDEASVLSEPVRPKKAMLVASSALVGGLLASFFLLARSSLRRPIESPKDLDGLGTPVYAVIPRSRVQTRLDARPDSAGGVLARESPDELTVEAIRGLRTSLYFGLGNDDDASGVVCVTGPSPGVGKSFICANLAWLAAGSGQRVLLVDADMRRGTLASRFGVPGDRPGLSELLAGRVDARAATREIELATGSEPHRSRRPSRARMPAAIADRLEPGEGDVPEIGEIDLGEESASFSLMTRGKAPPNPSELLMHRRFRELISEASAAYDLVIIDTPPVLAATDSLIVGKYADMNLMVVRQDDTALHDAEEVLAIYRNNHSRVNGIVLNGYEARGNHYGASYGYRYSYP